MLYFFNILQNLFIWSLDFSHFCFYSHYCCASNGSCSEFIYWLSEVLFRPKVCFFHVITHTLNVNHEFR